MRRVRVKGEARLAPPTAACSAVACPLWADLGSSAALGAPLFTCGLYWVGACPLQIFR